jgi:hypothetical protein
MSHNTCYQWKITINVNLSGFKNFKNQNKSLEELEERNHKCNPEGPLQSIKIK